MYEKIGRVKYDASLLKYVRRACKSGGVISEKEAKRLFKLLQDGGRYSDTEKKTMAYIRKNYKWTKKADAWFRSAVRLWAAARGLKTRGLKPRVTGITKKTTKKK